MIAGRMSEMPIASQEHDLRVQVLTAKTNKQALNALLVSYMPFIKKCVSSVFFKSQSRLDNLSEAMLAFTSSVLSYEPEQGAFIQYAAVVIRNRLLDNARKELSVQRRFFSSQTSEQEAALWDATLSLAVYNREEEERHLRLEIEDCSDEFSRWGLSWETLLKKCPKQERSRRLSWQIAQTVLQTPELLADTLRTRQLPVSRLARLYSPKALEKYRHYIIALIVLSQGNYPYIYSFVPHYFSREDSL